MARKCKVCEHGKIEEINQALIETRNISEISRKYNLPWDSLRAHKRNHLPAALTKAQEAQEVAQADSLLDQIEALRDKAVQLLNQAENAGDLKTALAGIGQARACLELLAKVRGELAQEGAVNITISAEWIELRAVILQTLEPYPEVKRQLSEALKRKEGQNGYKG